MADISPEREDAATRNLFSLANWGRKRLNQKTSEEEYFISSTRLSFQSQPNQKQFKDTDRERAREREREGEREGRLPNKDLCEGVESCIRNTSRSRRHKISTEYPPHSAEWGLTE